MKCFALSTLLGLRVISVAAFSKNAFRPRTQPVRLSRSHVLHSTIKNEETASTYKPIFNFAEDSEEAVSKFERIDDAIMGGISLSALKQLPGEAFARWSGICRLDGG
jgi:hypothetical protein